MGIRERWDFDVATDMGEEQHYSIAELLRRANEHLQQNEFDECFSYLKRAESSDAGKLELARFYLYSGATRLTQENRYLEAEKMLLQITDIPQACWELSSLYWVLDRPLASLAWLLHSGKKLDTDELSKYKKKIRNLQVTALERYPHDVYILGMELSKDKETQAHGIHLLKLTCDYGHGICVGVAALRIADISNNQQDLKRYLEIAEAYGNPDILRHNSYIQKKNQYFYNFKGGKTNGRQ